MPLRVFDYRTDIQNLEITPEIRARFMQLGPHEAADAHSHDLGHEAFLVLQGTLEVVSGDDTAVLHPGQFCFSRAGERHRVRNLGDEPVVLYLSVTPHVEPTHTFWSHDGERLPARYGGSTQRDSEYRASIQNVPLVDLARQQAAAIDQLSHSVAKAARALAELTARLESHQQSSEEQAALGQIVDGIWAALFPVFRDTPLVADAWNRFAIRGAGTSESVVR